jgi:hypothetical protein
MKEIKTAFSDDTLEATPARILTFLRAVGTTPALWAQLHTRGYAKEDHEEGWDLLHRVSGKTTQAPAPLAGGSPARDAIHTLEVWVGDGYLLASSTLGRRHPAQAAFVFDGLAELKDKDVPLSVRTFLDRLDELESSPDRTATRKEDHAALQSLVPRGIDPAQRARLRALVEQSEQPTEQGESPDPAAASKAAEQMKADLTALKAWFDEWSGVARAVIKRRDYLIRLGLLKRKKPKKADPAPSTPAGTPAKS